jgi:hypothetical protein
MNRRAEKPRRSAGTKTFTDLLRHPDQLWRMMRGLPATDPAIDLDDLKRGRPLIVVARRRDVTRQRGGMLLLHIDADDAIVWQAGGGPRRKPTGWPLSAPIEVEGVAEPGGPDRDQFRILRLRAAGRPWVLVIPTVDIPLVRAAIILANRRDPAGLTEDASH